MDRPQDRQTHETGKQIGLRCAINPYAGQEAAVGELEKDGNRRKAVVVGGGPGGMEAAMDLAKRDFDVTLFEAKERLGGQMYIASLPPHRYKMDFFPTWCAKQLDDLGVDVRLNTKATAETIREMDPCAVIIASGSVPIMPSSIEGINGDNVYVPEQVLTGKVKFENKKVVVVGAGLTGLETAEFIRVAGNEVTCIDMLDTCAAGSNPTHSADAELAVIATGIRTCPGHKLIAIKEDRIITEDNAGIRIEFPCDAVVMSLGVRAENKLAAELADMQNLYVIGEANHAGMKVGDAVHAAFDAVRSIR